jgi:hypothetical protein
MNKSRKLDQFYTKSDVAKLCLAHVSEFYTLEKFDMILEPSAGTGSFYNLLPKDTRIGLDIEPKDAGIQQMDFFDYKISGPKCLTIGNPPFGKNSSLAVKFFNHAATFSDVIAFIVPRTFKKSSLVSRLDLNFSLIVEYDLPENSFEFDGNDYDVPCVFQIWDRSLDKREKLKSVTTHEDFEFVNDLSLTDFGVQRVGANAGTIKDLVALQTLSKQSHYWIKSNARNVREVFDAIDWRSVKNNTAGNPSISKSEIIKLYEEQKRILDSRFVF